MNLEQLELQAEREKLARLLDTPAAELGMLDPLGVPGLRQLRQTLEAHIFDRGAKRFAGLARSSRLLPGKISGLIAQRALGPRLAAQVTGLLEPELAVSLAAHVSVEFQADLCQFLDPRRAGPVLRAMPESVVLETSQVLLGRREYMTMARFVDDLRDEQIAAVSAILEPLAMLWIGFYVESGARLSQLIATLDDRQLEGTLHAAAQDDLWPQALAMMARSDATTQARMTHLLAWAAPELAANLLAAARSHDLWSAIATVIQTASEADLRRIEAQLEELDPKGLATLHAARKALAAA